MDQSYKYTTFCEGSYNVSFSTFNLLQGFFWNTHTAHTHTRSKLRDIKKAMIGSLACIYNFQNNNNEQPHGLLLPSKHCAEDTQATFLM